MPAATRRATSWMAENDCELERSPKAVLSKGISRRTESSHGSTQSKIDHKKNSCTRLGSRRLIKPRAYEASLPDSAPGKKRCHRRPRVRSSSLLHVKWQS